MGVFRPEIKFEQGKVPTLSVIEAKFLEKTGLQLLTTSHLPTIKEIKSYEAFKEVLPDVGAMFLTKGSYTVKELYTIYYVEFADKIEIEYNLDEKYFPYAIMWTLEELGGKSEIEIPAKYKIKWAERILSDKLKP